MNHDKFTSTGDGACSTTANLMLGRQPRWNGERTRQAFQKPARLRPLERPGFPSTRHRACDRSRTGCDRAATPARMAGASASASASAGEDE